MRLSSFHQTQETSSCGAQPSPAPAKPNSTWRKRSWSATNNPAPTNSSAMILDTHEDSSTIPPDCGTFGPPPPAVVAPVPPSIIGSGGCTTSGGGAICPLDFPSPRFAACRKIKSSSKKRAGFTLVSNATQRAWKAVDSLRECQFGEVFLAVEVTYASSGRGWGRASSSPKYFAIKEMSIQKIRETRGRLHEDPLREVSVLQYLSREEHVNVLQCTEALKDQEGIYIVTPFFGGELFDVLTDKGQFSEEEARPLFRQVLNALLHLKRHGVCHRDVSLENLLLDEANRVKLIDFGLALRIPQTADGRARVLPPQGACGKQNYISPEVLINTGSFDGFAVDVWACGVLFFVLLTGAPPFELALPSKDQRCQVVAVEERLGDLLSMWKMPLSAEVTDMIQSCLLYEPQRRPSLEDLERHPWFNA